LTSPHFVRGSSGIDFGIIFERNVSWAVFTYSNIAFQANLDFDRFHIYIVYIADSSGIKKRHHRRDVGKIKNCRPAEALHPTHYTQVRS